MFLRARFWNSPASYSQRLRGGNAKGRRKALFKKRAGLKPLLSSRAAGLQAKRPVLYVGGGCLDSYQELREFVQRTGIPVVQTLMGLGTFPASDPLALQVSPTLAFQKT